MSLLIYSLSISKKQEETHYYDASLFYPYLSPQTFNTRRQNEYKWLKMSWNGVGLESIRQCWGPTAPTS